jgi:excisionase family DNA binding protein
MKPRHRPANDVEVLARPRLPATTRDAGDSASPTAARAADAFAATIGALADLPRVVVELQTRLTNLETRLTLAERRPYSVAEAARALGVSQKTIRRRVADGGLKVVRTGARIAIYLDEPGEDEVSAVVLKKP